jgi:FkbM family methyltransferase
MNYTEFHGDLDNGVRLDEVLRNRYFKDYEYKGVIVEIGAYDPILISNSYHFEKNGWNVYCFEANTQLIPRLKEYRRNVYNYAVYDEDKESVEFNVVTSSGWTAGFSAVEIDEEHIKMVAHNNNTEFPITKIQVEQKTLNSILENELKYLTQIDVLAMDIEGGELKCLQGLDLNKYRPFIILAENGGGCKTNIEDITGYLTNNGYILDLSLSYNLFFIDSKKALSKI